MKLLKIHNNENMNVTEHFTERTGKSDPGDYYFYRYHYGGSINLDHFTGDLRNSIEEEILNRPIPVPVQDLINLESPIRNMGSDGQSIYNQSDENWLAKMNYIYPENGWRCERINNNFIQKKIGNETFLYVSCKYIIYARGSVVAEPDSLISDSYITRNHDLTYYVNTISVFNIKQFTENQFTDPSFFNDDYTLSPLEKEIYKQFQTIKPLQRLAFRTIADFRVDETQNLDEYFENIMSNVEPKDADAIYQNITLDGQEFNGTFTGNYRKIVSSFSDPVGISTEEMVVPKKISSFQNTIIYDITELDPTDPNTYVRPGFGMPIKIWSGEHRPNPDYNGKYHSVGPFPQLAYKYPRYFWGDLNGKFGNYIVNSITNTASDTEYLKFENINFYQNDDSAPAYQFDNIIQGSMPSYYDEDYRTIHTEEWHKWSAYTNSYYTVYSDDNTNLKPLRYNWHSAIARDLLTEEIIGIKSIDTDNYSFLFLSMGNRPHFEYTSGSIIAAPVHYALEVELDPSGENFTHQVHTAFRFIKNVDNEDKDQNDVIVKLQKSEVINYDDLSGDVDSFGSIRPQMLPDAVYRLKILDSGLIDTTSLVNIHSNSMDLELDFQQSKIVNTHAYQQENGQGITPQSSFGVLSHLIAEDPYFAIRHMDGVKFEFDHTFINSASLFFGCRFLYNNYMNSEIQSTYNELAEEQGMVLLNEKNGTTINQWVPFFNWMQFTPHYSIEPELRSPYSNGIYGNIPSQPNSGWYSYREQLVTKKYGSSYLAFEVVK